jgi:hypothetical protein
VTARPAHLSSRPRQLDVACLTAASMVQSTFASLPLLLISKDPYWAAGGKGESSSAEEPA